MERVPAVGSIGSLPPTDPPRPDVSRAASDGPLASSAVVSGPEIEVMVEPTLLEEPQEETLVAGDPLSSTTDAALSAPSALDAEKEEECEMMLVDYPISSKRKALKSVSPGEKCFRSARSSSEEDVVMPKSSSGRRRRRIIESKEISPREENIFLGHSTPSAIAVSAASTASGSDCVSKSKSQRKTTRSGKCFNEEINIIMDSDDDLNITDNNVLTICDLLHKWLSEIDSLRNKCGRLQGVINSRLKDLVIKSKSAVSTIAGRYEASEDTAFLKMRVKELTLTLKGLETVNTRLKADNKSPSSINKNITYSSKACQTPAVSGLSSASYVSAEVMIDDGNSFPPASPFPSAPSLCSKSKNLLPPPLSSNISPLPSPFPPQAMVQDFTDRFDRFVELKAEMIQQINDMSDIVNGYASLFDKRLPVAVGASSVPPAPVTVNTAGNKLKPKPRVRIVADEKLAKPVFETVEIPATSDSATDDGWNRVVKRFVKEKN